MKLYIRADGDGKIGTGHIMRCIALAQTWQDQGGEVTFISHCDSVPLKQRMHDEGISLIPIDRVCPDPSDIETTLSILKKDLTDKKTWLVLDGYHFTSEYQKAIREKGIRLLVMDDMNHLTMGAPNHDNEVVEPQEEPHPHYDSDSDQSVASDVQAAIVASLQD